MGPGHLILLTSRGADRPIRVTCARGVHPEERARDVAALDGLDSLLVAEALEAEDPIGAEKQLRQALAGRETATPGWYDVSVEDAKAAALSLLGGPSGPDKAAFAGFESAIADLDVAAIDALLEAEADPTGRDDDGRSSLEILALRVPRPGERPSFEAILTKLQGKGGRATTEDMTGLTPIDLAAKALNSAALAMFGKRAELGVDPYGPRLLERMLMPLGVALAVQDSGDIANGLECLEILTAAGLDGQKLLPQGQPAAPALLTAIQRALADRNQEAFDEKSTVRALSILAAANADLAGLSLQGETPWEMAERRRWPTVQKALPTPSHLVRRRIVRAAAALTLVAAVAAGAFFGVPLVAELVAQSESTPTPEPILPPLPMDEISLCGQPETSPRSSRLAAPWDEHRCSLPPGGDASRCLSRADYTDQLGRGCPAEQLCCPPPDTGPTSWWCLCYAAANPTGGEAQTVTTCFSEVSSCEDLARRAERGDEEVTALFERCRPGQQRTHHPADLWGAREAWRPVSGGGGFSLVGSCLLPR